MLRSMLRTLARMIHDKMIQSTIRTFPGDSEDWPRRSPPPTKTVSAGDNQHSGRKGAGGMLCYLGLAVSGVPEKCT
eukprot:9480453-Pyramimonas_sp.AAC.1